jgi:hypothetical protein
VIIEAKPIETVTSSRAADVLLKRKAARSHLLPFVEYTHPSWTSGEHHGIICDVLERVERGELKRVIITAPPRSSKSELCTVRFPAWLLGRSPTKQVICASYGADLASDFGGQVRDIVAGREFRAVFPGVQLKRDSVSKSRWRTSAGGWYVAAGVGGPVTGRGAHVAIIDDPIKNQAEADSPLRREAVVKWYRSTMRTRLMPGGAIVLITTRWHEEDLAGVLMRDEPGTWHVVHFKAIECEHTDHEQSLWPEWWSLDELRRTRKEVYPRVWAALYQGEPQTEVGGYCRRDWYADRYTEAPKGARIYMASDYAVSEPAEGAEPDFTEHGVFGLLGDEVFVLDWWFGQTSPDVWIAEQIRLVKKWRPHCCFGEGGVIAKAVRPLLIRMARDAKTHWRQEWIPSVNDKAVRGRAMQGMSSMGRIRFGRQEWAERIISQLCRFPAGKDDAFDTISLLCLALESAHPAIVGGSKDPKKPRDGYADRQEDERTWRTV